MGSYEVETPAGNTPPSIHTDRLEAIAVVGFSIGFPQDATSSDAFWEVLMEKRNTASTIPNARMNIDALYHPDTNRRGQIPISRSHFLRQDIACFDAPFFRTSTTDAASMDPQQRLLLEYTYTALENAGMPMETVSGSRTSVYTGSFATDWQHLAFKDGEQCETTTALGTQACFNANRISWFFDFVGNSANIDTACSSSLVALDLGCQGLLSGGEDMSIVAGSNLILSPDNMHSLTNLNMLSPDGQCYSFDHRANGYSRGEGIGVLVLKRVSDAIRDHNTIRGIIRSTGCNQDGNTPSITVPSSISQENLIRETYKKAGLSMEPTRFFEAHGTGTPVGDPNESKALGAAFRHTRTVQDPLWVGAVKSNIGHLEGASGVAGVIKAILVLEKGIIPPNTNFERVNPKIDMDFLRIKFPLEPIPWPSKGLRRASVNSFGNAGTNAHVVLDDVFHFLSQRGLDGHAYHMTVRDPPAPQLFEPALPNCVPPNKAIAPQKQQKQDIGTKLLIISAFDAAGVARQAKSIANYYSNLEVSTHQCQTNLDDLAFTLCMKRSALPFKASGIITSLEDLYSLEKTISAPTKSRPGVQLGFIFTGQGAQWTGMGRELMVFPTFRQSILRSEDFLLKLGSSWHLCEYIQREESSHINSPQFSQPICSAIQIALVDLLRSFDIYPTVVIGHSSGEIAAAYSTGAISARSALKLAYYRGSLAGSLATSAPLKGGMMSVGLSKDQVMVYLNRVNSQCGRKALTTACINSPKNVTVSGDDDQIGILKDILDSERVPTHKLFVDVAYHSPHMDTISEDYNTMIQGLESGDPPPTPITMISSLTGKILDKKTLLTPDYWTRNLISPVKFVDAVQTLLSRSGQRIRHKLDLSHRHYFQVGMLVEVGPHSGLRGPINDILDDWGGATKISYTSVLIRKTSAINSMLNAVGQMGCLGYPVNLERVNHSNTKDGKPRMTLPDLPEYVFNHSKQYWSESRLSTRYRLHHQGKLDLLGKPVMDWNPMEARWRNILRLSEMPWMEDHVINGSVIYPGAGMIVMAVEAANQLSGGSCDVTGFEVKDVSFLKSLNIPPGTGGIETQLSIHTTQTSSKPLSIWSKFRLFAYEQGLWLECCHGFIRVNYEAGANEVSQDEEYNELQAFRRIDGSMTQSCKTVFDPKMFYGTLQKSGLGLGPSFHCVTEGTYGDQKQAQGTLRLYEWPTKEHPQPHIIHPISLDALFHFAIAGYFGGGTRGVSTMVPTFLRRLLIRKNGVNFSENQYVRESAWTTTEDSLGVGFSGFALNVTKDKALLNFQDLRVTKIGEYLENPESPALLQEAYNISHRPDPDLLDSAETLLSCQQNSHLDKANFDFYIDMIGHKNSNLKLLEIGSSMDGNMISRILRDLTEYDGKGEPVYTRYDSYCYASHHRGLLDDMQEKYQGYPRLTFARLDAEEDPLKQGIEAESFDVILAPRQFRDNSLFLQHVRSMLKSRGKLMFHELDQSSIPDSKSFLVNGAGSSMHTYGFGSPGLQISASRGTEAVSTVHVHQIIPNTSPDLNSKRICIVSDANSISQAHSTKQLTDILLSRGFKHVSNTSLVEGAAVSPSDEVVFVVLLELDQPFLNSMSKDDYDLLKQFFISGQNILWGNSVVSPPGNPEHALIQGLARVLRNEHEGNLLTVVSFENQDTLSERQLVKMVEILVRNHIIDSVQSIGDKDFEYIEIEGTFSIPRISPDRALSHELQVRSSNQQSSMSLFQAQPLRLTLGSVGILNTLHFIEDKESAQPLADDEVEIRTHAIGMNFKDCLIALAQLSNCQMGQECAGIVARAGRATNFLPGDRVVMATDEGFMTFAKGKAHSACKIPDDMPFTTAAAIPAQFGTAWGALKGLARLQSGDSILIHAAAGGTGQAAIQIAKLIGATIFATVSSLSKKQILIDEYQIPEEHIFYSRDTRFVEGIKRLTSGRGVDVVLNSLIGDGLVASWECVAPCGRFIEIGKKDIMSNSNLPMSVFEKNVSFTGFDGALWGKHNHDLVLLIVMFADKTLHLPRPFQIYDISQIEEVFKLVQEGKFAGKIVLEATPDSRVPTTLDNKPTTQLDPNATYVIAGGFGGIGRATTRWMVSRNARNLILLSRYGPRTAAAEEMLQEVRDQGVRVEAPACDITNTALMQEVFEHLISTMPPIKGCVQASIIAKDGLFKDMSYDSWKLAVDCKVVGSWNLHSVLPQGMDFFVFLASASGLAGLRGQANYNAGNTYEDALARYRVSQGERAISLDLGAMTEDGILAENPHLLDRVLGYGTLEPISRKKYYDILDYYCNPSLPLLTPTGSQAAIGLGVGGGSGLESFDFTRQAMLYPLVLDGIRQETPAAELKQADYRQLLGSSASLDEAGEFVMQAVVGKLANSISAMQDKGSIETRKPLQMYGVDSLLAIELRNWIVKEFLADIAVFETQGASTLETLSRLVAGRSSIKHDKWNM